VRRELEREKYQKIGREEEGRGPTGTIERGKNQEGEQENHPKPPPNLV
jgi:hypothetical protein